jgi:flagellar motor protein MotB
MNGYVPMQYPMASGMTVQGVPQTMPVVLPVSSQPPPQQQQLVHDTTIERKLAEQEIKLAERQAELAKISEKLHTLRREQQKSLEEQQQQLAQQRQQYQQQQQQQEQEQRQQQQRQQEQHHYQQQQERLQQANQNQERLQQSQSARPSQSPPTKPAVWNQSNDSEFLSNKHGRGPNRSIHPGISSSFLKPKSDLLPPSEFRDRHPTPPTQPARSTTSSAVPRPPSVNEEYVDGPVLKSKTDAGTASVVLALHNQRPSHHSPTKIYHAPTQSDLATTSFTVVMTEKPGRTELYRKRAGPYLTYQNVKWKMFLRKEVRMPLS